MEAIRRPTIRFLANKRCLVFLLSLFDFGPFFVSNYSSEFERTTMLIFHHLSGWLSIVRILFIESKSRDSRQSRLTGL